MGDPKAKIIVVGPVHAGKTRLANHIAEFESDPNFETYSPTAGVRILEFDRDVAYAPKKGGAGRAVKLAVELWDCSGDQQYEACWPAILSNVAGAILVYNPENPAHERDISRWYSAFLAKLSLGNKQLLVLAHHRQGSTPGAKSSPPSQLSAFQLEDTALDSQEAVNALRSTVDAFLARVGATALETHETELDNL